MLEVDRCKNMLGQIANIETPLFCDYDYQMMPCLGPILRMQCRGVAFRLGEAWAITISRDDTLSCPRAITNIMITSSVHIVNFTPWYFVLVLGMHFCNLIPTQSLGSLSGPTDLNSTQEY